MRSRRRLRWLSIAGLVLGVVGSSVVAAAPAVAMPIPGLTRVDNTLPGLNAAVAVTAKCPIDYLVYGLGGEVTGGNGQVALVSMLPNAALTSVTVIAAPVVPAVAPWNVTAYAICGRPTAGLHVELSPAPGAGVDVEVCNASVLWGSGARQGGHPAASLREMAPNAAAAPPVWTRASVNGPPGGVASAAICGLNLGQFSIVAPAAIGSTATCPGMSRVHSTGGLIISNDPAVVFEGIVPNLALTQVRVTARDTGGPRPTVAYAVCA
jgi:hypothetical protein